MRLGNLNFILQMDDCLNSNKWSKMVIINTNFVLNLCRFQVSMVRTIYTILLLLVTVRLSSQAYQLQTGTDNSSAFVILTNEQLRHLDSLYVAEAGIEKEFINGKDYRQNYYRSAVNPLLRAGEERTGTLIYRTREYPGIDLQYDTFLDELICTDNSLVFDNTVHQVSLNRDNVPGFKLIFAHDTLVFRYFSAKTDPGFNLGEGYYEVVYDGSCTYLIRHESDHYKLHGADNYSYEPAGYVRIGEQFARIRGRKDFLLLFGDSAKEISHFISENKIRIKSADKHRIASVLIFYERTIDEEKD